MRTRIKEFRARYDMTQEELARRVGVRRETILYMEAGKYVPSLKLAHDVSKALGAGIEGLFLFDDEEPPNPPVPAVSPAIDKRARRSPAASGDGG
ncbi:MAG: helix-turn-helix transcriptional regulator [Euryarchaeota archaeon]|nr:helix-turn-helix transcriptional regulator [Euryarchaeota archaeon]